MRTCALGLFLLPAVLWAQRLPQLNHGEAHGDPPFLVEDGWRPLLNGRDLSGWHPQSGKSDWFTTRGVRWERFLGPARLAAIPQPGDRIVNGPTGRTANLVTDGTFGDIELYLEFMVSEGSNSGVYLQGLYEIQIFDSFGSTAPLRTSDGGAVYHQWINQQGVGGSAPKVNASRPPGEWQSYQIWFRAPRFDASGKKIEKAKFIQVLHNNVLVQENVEVDGPTRAHMNHTEGPLHPLMLQGDHGPVAFRNIYVRPLRPIVNR